MTDLLHVYIDFIKLSAFLQTNAIKRDDIVCSAEMVVVL